MSLSARLSDTGDWRVFTGITGADSHQRLKGLPVPPWRRSLPVTQPESFDAQALEATEEKGRPFLPDNEMVQAVNAALYLRRPLLLTGKPGCGKSTLIAKVARELRLGPVLRWDITSRSTVRSGVYEYDAIGRLQKSQAGLAEPAIEEYLSLGPLGTALLGTTWPRALLVDEIDKGDLDLANDLLNVIEEGEFDIPELRRLGHRTLQIKDGFGRECAITDGRLRCRQFPLVVMTSNAEREFPPAFQRRCIRLTIKPANTVQALTEVVESHLSRFIQGREAERDELINEFLTRSVDSEVSTDQLLNAVFLTVGMQSSKEEDGKGDLASLRELLLQRLQ